MDSTLSKTIFSTQRLVVRLYQPGDEDNFFALNGNEEVMRYIRAVKPREESDRFFKEVVGAYEIFPKTGRWAVNDKQSGEFIGSFAIIPVPGDETKTQLGYSLLPAHWGKGYATELTKSGLEYVDSKLKLDQIFGIAETANIPSCNVLIKCGFEFFETRMEEGKELMVYVRRAPNV